MSAATDQPETTYPEQQELIGEPAAVAEAPAIDPYTRDVMADRHRAGDSIADLADDYGIPAEQVQAAVEQAPRSVRRRHRWEEEARGAGGSLVASYVRCRRCGLTGRKMLTRGGHSLRLEVLPDDGVWTAEISECPGEQDGQATELEQENDLLRARCAEEQVRADWLDRKLKKAQAELSTLKEERRQIQWGSLSLADQAEAELAGLRRELAAAKAALPTRQRRVPPPERQSTTKRFDVAGTHGYLTVGHYPTGEPCELFILIAKEGSTIRGLLDGWARMFSIALQHGVPLDHLIEKVKGARFEPSGWTDDPEITPVASILDYVARWLERRYLPPSAAGEQPQGEQR